MIQPVGVVLDPQLAQCLLCQRALKCQILDLLELPIESIGADDPKTASRCRARVAEAMDHAGRHVDERARPKALHVVADVEVELALQRLLVPSCRFACIACAFYEHSGYT